MKKQIIPFLFSLLFFSACTQENAPNDAGTDDVSKDYVISVEDQMADTVEEVKKDGETKDEETKDGEKTDEDSKNPDEIKDINECREKNAEISLQLESAEKKLMTCKETLENEQKSKKGGGMKESQSKMIRYAVLNTNQPEYPFACGRMADYFKKGWFDSFVQALGTAQIPFANGFLESQDLFSGCHSDQGKMAFFLGAERGEDLKFFLIRFNITDKILEPAIMFDGSDTAVVTKPGKRLGAYIKFPSDDGRVFRYYYDANVVVDAEAEPEVKKAEPTPAAQ